MRVVLISDTHGAHRKIRLPKGDLLIHAGDMTNIGEIEQFRDFNAWMGEQPFKHKIAIAGNHDRTLDMSSECRYWRKLVLDMFTDFTYLENSGVTIEGLKIWGSPWTPFFASDYWRFHLRTPQARIENWLAIPGNTDILITHGPPLGTLDRTLEGELAGDAELRREIAYRYRQGDELPRLHVFGHIHEGHGVIKYDAGQFAVNASIMTRVYNPTNLPWVWDTEKNTITNQ